MKVFYYMTRVVSSCKSGIMGAQWGGEGKGAT